MHQNVRFRAKKLLSFDHWNIGLYSLEVSSLRFLLRLLLTVIEWLAYSLQSHFSIKRAGVLLGVGSDNVIIIDSDQR